MALSLKNEGNEAFKNGDYKEAERLYTRAIQRDPENAAFYTNRALARIRMSSWDGCMDDCLKVIGLLPRPSHDAKDYLRSPPTNPEMKAWFYYAQATLAKNHPAEAHSSAIRAYEMCRAMGAASTAQVSAFVLEAKKAKWQQSEGERLKRQSSLLADVEEGLRLLRERNQKDLEEKLQELSLDGGSGADDSELEEQRQELRDTWRKKVDEVRSIFATADPSTLGNREVPDYLVDNITFSVMHDPVVTKHGHSYERTTIEAHLAHSETDPLTRDRLTKADLRPNLALKQAASEYLDANGWAVDW